MSNEPKDLLPPRGPHRDPVRDPVADSYKTYPLSSLNAGPEMDQAIAQAGADAEAAAEVRREHNDAFAAELEGRGVGPTREKVAP